MITAERLNTWIKYLSVAVLGYILVLASVIKTPEMFHLPSYAIAVIFAAMAITVVLLVHWMQKQTFFKSNKFYFTLLAFLVIIPRMIWIAFIDSVPTSDFFLYHEYAANASKGIFNIYHFTYTIFPFKFGYPLVLALFYAIFGVHILVIKILNVVLSLLLSCIVYWVGKNIFNENTGKIAGLGVALWPSQIMYSSVLASEHVFIIFFMLAIGMMVKAGREESSKRLAGFMAIAGVAMAFANFIRPVAIILIPIFLVSILCFAGKKEMTLPRNLMKKAAAAGVVLVSFALTFALLTVPLSKVIGVPIYKSSSGYNMLVGTNFASKGMYNAEDEKILQEFNLDYDKVHKAAARRAVSRILSNPRGFLYLTEQKYITQWTYEDYGLAWSMDKLGSTNFFSNLIVRFPYICIAPAQFIYLLVLLFALLGAVFLSKKNRLVIPLLLVFLGLFAAFTFLEVQSRYHFPAIPILMVFGGFGILETLNYLNRKRQREFTGVLDFLKGHRVLVGVVMLIFAFLLVGGYILKKTALYASAETFFKRAAYEVKQDKYIKNGAKKENLTLYKPDDRILEIYSRLSDGNLLMTRLSKREWGVWNLDGWYIAEDDRIPTEKPYLMAGGGSDWEYVFRVAESAAATCVFSGGNHGREKLLGLTLLDGTTNSEIPLKPYQKVEVKDLKIVENTALALDEGATDVYARVKRAYDVQTAKVDFQADINFQKEVCMTTSYVCMLPMQKALGRYIRFNDTGHTYITPRAGETLSTEKFSNYLGKEKTLSVDLWGESYLPYKFRAWIDNENMVDKFDNQLKVFYWDLNCDENKLYFSKYNDGNYIRISANTTWQHKQGWELMVE